MKIISNFLLTLLLTLSLASGAWGGSQQLDKITESVTGRGVYIDGNYAYIATLGAVKKVDITDPSAATVESTISTGLTSGYDCLVDGDYLYVTSRTSGATWSTKADFQSTFDEGDTDLSNGSSGYDFDEDSTAEGAFNGGGISNGTIVGNEAGRLGEYHAKMVWTAGSAYAYTKITGLTGGADNEVLFWFRCNSLTGSSLAYVAAMRSAATIVCPLTILPNDATTYYLYPRVYHAGGGTPALQNIDSAAFNYNQWYLIKMRYRIHETEGGGQWWYKANFGDAWTDAGSNYTLDTSLYTPDELRVGLVWCAATLTAGTCYYDEVCFENGDLDAKYGDEGELSIVDLTTETETGTINFEEKMCNLIKDGDYVYVGARQYGFHVFDVSDTADPQWVWGWDANASQRNDCHGLHQSGDYVYVGNYFNGMLVFDLSTQSAPAYYGSVDLTDAAGRLWDVECDSIHCFGTVMRGGIYDVDSEDDIRGLVSFDISNPASPIISDMLYFRDYDICGETHMADHPPLHIKLEKKFAYIGNGTIGSQGAIVVVDVLAAGRLQYKDTILTDDDIAIEGLDVSDGVLVTADGSNSEAGTDDIYIFSYEFVHKGIIKILTAIELLP